MSPGALDLAVATRHLASLDAAVQHLRKHQGRPLTVLRTDPDERWIVERGLQLCCQNALDLALHLVAQAGHDAQDYAQAVDQLAALAVLPPDFATEFRRMAGFRNALVHGYLDVDPAIVHRVLNDHLDDFERFGVLVRHHLGDDATE